jgi:hypothetical protein
MGSRNMEQEGVPGKSSFGNKFSNFWFKVETGLTLPDTQTGFRLYPLAPLKRMSLFTTKFETEIEVIVKMAWKDVPIIPINIQVIYDKDERVTHFRPFRDFTRISILNTWLVTLTLVYYLPKRLFRYIKKKGLWKIIRDEAVKPDETNFSKAKSVGFGFFMGIVPIWGFQLMVGSRYRSFFDEQGAFPHRGAYQHSAGHSFHHLRKLQIRRAVLPQRRTDHFPGKSDVAIHSCQLCTIFFRWHAPCRSCGSGGFCSYFSAADIASPEALKGLFLQLIFIDYTKLIIL